MHSDGTGERSQNLGQDMNFEFYGQNCAWINHHKDKLFYSLRLSILPLDFTITTCWKIRTPWRSVCDVAQ